jgi:hypothetical protein
MSGGIETAPGKFSLLCRGDPGCTWELATITEVSFGILIMCNKASVNLAKLNYFAKSLYLAQVANLAYRLTGDTDAVNANSIAKIEEDLEPLGLHLTPHAGNPFFDPATNAEGFMATTPTDVVIAIKGSWELADWQNDLQLWQETCVDGGQVHAGFRAATLHLLSVLTPELRQNAGYAVKQLWLTGHSSGGAIAVLLAHRFHLIDIDVAGIYTYGAPKVGDSAYARIYPLRDRLHVFKTAGDIIPSMPASHYHLHDWRLRYAEYVHIVEPEELSGEISSPTPGILNEISNGKSLEQIAARTVESSAHSLIGAYIPLLEAATAPMRGVTILPAARGEDNADQRRRS